MVRTGGLEFYCLMLSCFDIVYCETKLVMLKIKTNPDAKANSVKGVQHTVFYAKTIRDEDTVIFGRTVLSHCLVVGHVARELIKYYPVSLIEKYFPQGSELIAALHDIGKISPTFQNKLLSAVKKSAVYWAGLSA